MSAPVTEAHLLLAEQLIQDTKLSSIAQLIADSEALATAELKKRADHWCDMHTVCAKERDQLRAVFPKILEALGNGACCTPDVSVEFIKAIPNEVAEVVAQLRAEVNAQCMLNAKGSEREAVLLGRVDRMAKECLNLRADLDAIKAIRDEEKARAESAEREVERLKDHAFDKDGTPWKTVCGWWSKKYDTAERQMGENAARAERAEASLHALRLVCGTTDADKFSTWVDRANARAEKAEAELAKAKAVLASIEEDGTEEHNAAVRLRQELAAERAIVSRIWVQLGSPTYEQLKGRSIYCLIDELKAELATERAKYNQLLSALVYADQILDDIDTCSDAHKPMYSSYSQNVFKLCIKGRDARRAAIDAAMKEETK